MLPPLTDDAAADVHTDTCTRHHIITYSYMLSHILPHAVADTHPHHDAVVHMIAYLTTSYIITTHHMACTPAAT